MSADNGMFVCGFPVRGSDAFEWRVGYATMSVIDELESPWVSGEEYPEVVKSIFGKSPVFLTEEEASAYAFKEIKKIGYTEYGVSGIMLKVPFGEKRADIPHPPLPKGACPRCSTPFSVTMHGGGPNAVCDKDPALPKNILVAAIRQKFPGIYEHVVAQAMLDALDAAGKMIVDKPEFHKKES